MNIIKANNLACPIDGEPLALNQLEFKNRQLVCSNGHSFDISRQGYVNLLPVQHKRSKHPGDSKEMVSARTRFLNTGLYTPIADKLAETALAQIVDDSNTCIMDAGCGEGYYLDYVLHYLNDKNISGDFSFIGQDISKEAIVKSAKRNKKISWVVGTNRQPPIMPGTVNIILCVFGFPSFKGFNKIMPVGGKVVLVEPGPDHLKELREVSYAEVKKSEPQNLSDAFESGFSLVDDQQLNFKAKAITNKQIYDLLMMTPHFFRASKEGKNAASQLNDLTLTVDIFYRILEKNNVA